MRLHDQPLVFNEVQLEQIDRLLFRLADRTSSPLVLLADVSGRLVLYRGRLPESQSVGLAALAAGSFAATVEIGSFLGLKESHAFRRQLHEGPLASLYTLGVGAELILVIAFTSQTTLGYVRLFVQRTQQELLEIVEEAIAFRASQPAGERLLDEDFGDELSDELNRLFPHS
jgi:hypothetical protein